MSQSAIILYRDNYQNVRDVLTCEQKGRLLDALMDGEYSGDDPVVRMAFNVFEAAIRRTDEKYRERCEKNAENARKRWAQYEQMKADAIAYGRIKGLEGLANQNLAQDHTQAQDHEDTQGEKKRKKFTSPTVEEVKAYCDERRNGIDPEAFCDYYQARGWEVRPGQKMKDWKASVRTWEKNKGRWKDERNRGNHEVDRIEGQREFYGL